MSRLRCLPLLLLLLTLATTLSACPDDVASTDLAQPQDMSAGAKDLASKD